MSGLDHVLGDHATMPEGLGLFLDRTHRLHPDICRFISEQVYDVRLESEPHCALQAIDDGPVVGGTGLRWLRVDHESNRTSSVEEAHAVAEAFEALLGRGWTDGNGQRKTLGLDDVLVVAPYNVQVHVLAQHLPEGARIGTVDNFQGQEAPVVIVSMTASSADDIPRGMEFLYSATASTSPSPEPKPSASWSPAPSFWPSTAAPSTRCASPTCSAAMWSWPAEVAARYEVTNPWPRHCKTAGDLEGKGSRKYPLSRACGNP